MATFVLAFDPGESTGIALLKYNQFHWPPEQVFAVTAITIEQLLKTWEVALRVSDPHPTVVAEEWKLFPGAATFKVGSHFPEIERLGQIKLLAHMNGWQVIEQAATCQSSSTWPVLTLQKLHITWDTPHERSALCHGLYYLKRLYLQDRSKMKQ